jgi:hypothetical protein
MKMRRLVAAIAVCALAVGLTLAPGAAGKKAPKQVGGTVTLAATPSTVTTETTTITVSGNLATNSGCRKDRTVHFSYVGPTLVETPLAVTAETRGNGSFTAVLPKPTDAAPATVTLKATVDPATRKVGSKKKGKKTKKGRVFNCLEVEGQTTITVAS